MFSLVRWAFVLLVCLVVIGLFRGWFTVSKPNAEDDGHKVNISVSVDVDKVKADAEKAKQKIAERMAQQSKPSGDTAGSPQMK